MGELIVFDLQRFALHDGPGIRTTVFLKVCPLDCLWCHNPESKRSKPQLSFLEKQCTYCGRCAAVCKKDIHRVTIASGNNQHEIDFQSCQNCGTCVEACVHQALKIAGRPMSAEAILEAALRDEDFYQRSGGGLTISGGEPMLQYPGLLDLLRKAKKKGLHICLDTSGQAPQEYYREIAKLVDIFLFDYKITDSQVHKRYIGVENDLIISNLDFLGQRGSRIYLRCPIIPGINDNEAHYQQIAKLSQTYESIEQVNLMMYHDMAKGKATQIGEEYGLSELKTVELDEKKRISELVEACGCRKLCDS